MTERPITYKAYCGNESAALNALSLSDAVDEVLFLSARYDASSVDPYLTSSCYCEVTILGSDGMRAAIRVQIAMREPACTQGHYHVWCGGMGHEYAGGITYVFECIYCKWRKYAHAPVQCPNSEYRVNTYSLLDAYL